MIVCPSCHNQVADEEIQCPKCFLVLKQLSCGNCNNLLDLRYSQCIHCGQPYALPYQARVYESNRQDPPEVKEQQYTNQPVTQFSMQSTKSHRSNKNAFKTREKQKGSVFDGDKPKGFKLMIWALRPSNGKTLTARDNVKLLLMMFACAVFALLVIIAGFNIKDVIDNNAAANERAQRLTSADNTNSLISPTEQVTDDSYESKTNTSTSSTSKTVIVQDSNSTDLGAAFSISFLELIDLHNEKNKDFGITNGVDLSAYYLPTEGWLPLHTTTVKGNLSASNVLVTSLETITIGYEPETGNVDSVIIRSLIDDVKSATQMELVRCSLFLAALMNTDANHAYDWFKKGLDQSASNYLSTGNQGVQFFQNIGISATNAGWMIAAISNQIKSTMNAFNVPLN